MQLIEVTNTSTEKDFLEANVLLNKHNTAYIRPLDNEVKEVFDTKKNKHFANGKAIRWVLKNNNVIIGRIAAFTNSKYANKGTNFTVGCMGYFDCINNQDAANMLFVAAKNWLQQNGCEAMDGPVNFGDRDKWWGLMVEGFNKPPMYGMSFNPPYYETLLENFGFKNYYNQYYYSMSINDELPERFTERHAKFKAKPDYVAKHIEIKNIKKYASDFATVYNGAWAQHGESKEITVAEVEKLFDKLKPVIDERLVWFSYYKNEPIAMFINLPDLNEYFKHFNGKLGLIEKLRLLWMKKNGHCKRLTGLAFGVVPKYQALGIDSFMIKECSLLIKDSGWYDEYEMGWAGDWNPKMTNIYKSLGGKQSRKMITYRYIFDENKNPFERHPLMDYTAK